MKRPLGILAAALLSLSLLGSAPARAAASHPSSTVTMKPAVPQDDDDDDWDGGGHGHRGRCHAIIAICIG